MGQEKADPGADQEMIDGDRLSAFSRSAWEDMRGKGGNYNKGGWDEKDRDLLAEF